MATSTVVIVFYLLAVTSGFMVNQDTTAGRILAKGKHRSEGYVTYPFLPRIRFGSIWHTTDEKGDHLVCLMSYNGFLCRRKTQ